MGTFMGNQKANTLNGSAKDDSMFAREGNDIINGNGGNDLIYAGGGNDIVHGGAGNDRITGGEGNGTPSGEDRLFGDEGDDRIGGEDGNDYLDGGSGNDSLGGGTGNDTLVGGTGADVFNFYERIAPPGEDHIVDFNSAEGDKISLEGYNLTASDVAVSSLPTGETLVSMDTNHDGQADFHITLDNGAAVSASDFIFGPRGSAKVSLGGRNGSKSDAQIDSILPVVAVYDS